MDQQTLLVIMAVFTGVAAIALLIQAGLLFGMYKAARTVQEQVTRLTPKVESLMPKIESLVPKIEALTPKIEAVMESSRATIDESRIQIKEITIKAQSIMDVAHTQLQRVDALLSDASERTSRQLAHAEVLVEDTLERAHQTVTMVHSGVLKPIREINGVAAGIRAAVQYLTKGMRPTPERLTVDEEMFI